VRLVDHEAGAVAAAQLGDLAQGRDVALHGEHAVDHDEDPAAVHSRAVQRLLELLEPVVAERAELRAREEAPVEDRRVVARVGDDRVARAEDRAEHAEVRLVARGEDERRLRAHPVGQLLLELEMERDRAVEQARPGQPRPVGLQRLAGAGHDPGVVRQPEVVVRAEHDPPRALHLHDGQRGGGERAEVGQDVGLARGREHRQALVIAGLGEDVGRCRRGSGHV
jgi:hypothetical protein